MLSLTSTDFDSKPKQQTALSAGISGASTPNKTRATTLDIPGLTRSKVSPDGRIAQRDVGSKLVIVMVGLPARGKSYIVKKLQRYLNWLQHPTEIFNVGERRRVVAGKKRIPQRKSTQHKIETELRDSVRRMSLTSAAPHHVDEQSDMLPAPALATRVLLNGQDVAPDDSSTAQAIPAAVEGQQSQGAPKKPVRTDSLPMPAPETMDQNANFFDPENTKALQIREQVALETLDELLDYILFKNGSVGILDATNSTIERRKVVVDRINERTDGKLNVLFLESQCLDQGLLERNMHLKLFGPDYKGQDPEASLRDFKKRVEMYQKSYVPLGEYEEQNDMSYIQMVDVGRKLVAHQIKGFLSTQTVSYLMNFNLAPRQIWLTRHGESMDNVQGKLGGDSSLSLKGQKFAKDLAVFLGQERNTWEQNYAQKQEDLTFPPRSGSITPPNPQCSKTPADGRHFCVWTSMLKRSIETAKHFDEEEFDIKEMKMLDEINAGLFEGCTYEEIKKQSPREFHMRRNDKLQYRYPGLGGESYLDVINRLQKVIVEVERMTDHVLIIGHRSVTRILLAYFKNLKRKDVAHLDVPLGVVYMLEPVR